MIMIVVSYNTRLSDEPTDLNIKQKINTIPTCVYVCVYFIVFYTSYTKRFLESSHATIKFLKKLIIFFLRFDKFPGDVACVLKMSVVLRYEYVVFRARFVL